MTSPALEPIAERIALSIEEDLRGISVGGGYYTDAGRNVSPGGREPIETWQRFPTLFVEFAGEVFPVEGEVTSWGSTARIVVVGYVKSKSPRRDLLRLAADAKKAITKDPQRRGLAVETRLVEMETDVGDLARFDLAMFAFEFHVGYDWDATEGQFGT